MNDIMSNYVKLLESGKTVFTKNDINNLLEFDTKSAFDKFLFRAKKDNKLLNPHYGIYTLKDYDTYEFASKIKINSYISLETVLKKESVIFQYYESIFLVSDNTLEKNIEGQNYIFKKITYDILLNPIGIDYNGKYMIASAERAVCDRIYLSKNYYFDDISHLDLIKLEKISKIYNKRVILEVNNLIKNENK